MFTVLINSQSFVGSKYHHRYRICISYVKFTKSILQAYEKSTIQRCLKIAISQGKANVANQILINTKFYF